MLHSKTHGAWDQCAATDIGHDDWSVREVVVRFVNSGMITDEVIQDFESRHPNCTTIPYEGR